MPTNTCKLTIDHHPEGDQCGEDMITHAVHVEPVNVDAPQWILTEATRHMCPDPKHEHFLPDIGSTIALMGQRGLATVIVLAPDYWDIEEAFLYQEIARQLRQAPELDRRAPDTDTVIIDLAANSVTVTIRPWSAPDFREG